MSGRGGRGGRGRGVASMSFSVESLGFGRGEALPQAALAPPAIFPPLATQPLALVVDQQHEYMLVVRKELVSFWHDSLHYVRVPKRAGPVERYSDKYQDVTATAAANAVNRFSNVSAMPQELRVDVPVKRRRPAAAGLVKLQPKKQAVRLDAKEVTDKLDQLEQREKQQGDGKDEDQDREDDEPIEEEEPDVDAEMDDGTDYVNDFFDNGEDYLDAEDDALEEGPVF